MRLNVRASALTLGMIGGVVIMLGVGLLHMIWPDYGEASLRIAASIYPGYNAGPGVGQLLLGTVYGFVDGAVIGALIAWLYNRHLGATA